MSVEGFDQGFLGSLNPHDRYSNVYIALEKAGSLAGLLPIYLENPKHSISSMVKYYTEFVL